MKKAFTLAEVLLVIAIIGVVAAFSIPNLNSNINEDKNVIILRSSIEQLNAAYGRVLAEYGSRENASATSCGSLGTSACFASKIVSYLDTAQNCGATKNGKCFSRTTETNLFTHTTQSAADDDCSYMFVLANGAGVCYVSGDSWKLDVDGPKKGSTTFGADIFELTTFNNSFEPSNPGTTSTGRFEAFYDATAWAFQIGNLDYLKCPNALNWINKHSCD